MTNKKDLFIIEVVVSLGLAAMKTSFPAAAGLITFTQPILAFFARRFLGYLVGAGIATIDFTLDTLDQAKQRKEWEKTIDQIWDKTQAKVYDENEKAEIRKQYLAALRKYAGIGGGPK